MAGYNEYSQSNNALAANAEGKFPLTHAIARVATAAGCTKAIARKALEEVGECEWHHTSKQYNHTKFYSVGAAVAYLAAQPELAKLPFDWKIRFEKRWNELKVSSDVADAVGARETAAAEIANIAEINPAILVTAYYATWGEED